MACVSGGLLVMECGYHLEWGFKRALFGEAVWDKKNKACNVIIPTCTSTREGDKERECYQYHEVHWAETSSVF